MRASARHAAQRAVKDLARRWGVDVRAYQPRHFQELRRAKLLAEGGYSLVLDVGANDGGFGREIRRCGYHGRIVSFEPLRDAFARLTAATAGDPRWEAHRRALGAAEGDAEMHVADNEGASSSLLPTQNGAYERHASHIRFVATETVQVRRLDGVLPGILDDTDRVYLKVDVQGAELDVLRGAGAALGRIDAVEAELSLVRLYEGQPLFLEVAGFLEQQGFVIVSLETAFADLGAGDQLQVDAIAVRGASTDQRQ